MDHPLINWMKKFLFPILFCICYWAYSIVLPYLFTTSKSIGTQFRIGTSVFWWLVTSERVIFGFFVLVASYFGGKSQRKSKWIGYGFALIGVGCFLFALTAFLAPLPFVEKDESHLWKGIYIPASKEDIAHPHNLMDSYWGKKFPFDVRQHLNETGYRYLAMQEYRSNITKRSVSDQDLDNTIIDLRQELTFGIDQRPQSRVKRQMPDFEFPDSTRDRLKAGFEAAVIGLIWFGDPYEQFAQEVYNLTNDPEIFERIMISARLPFAYCRNTSMLVKHRLLKQTCQETVPNWTLLALVVAFLASGLMGAGGAVIGAVGLPYLEDMIGWRCLPKFVASLSSLQFLSAILGFGLGMVCDLMIYSTFKTPYPLNPIDPRWVGAWWLGLILISILLITPAIPMIILKFGPAKISVVNGNHENGTDVQLKIDEPEVVIKQSTPNVWKIRNIMDTIMEIFRLPVFTALIFATTFHVLAFYGYFMFLPIYLKNNFRPDALINGVFLISAKGIYLCIGIGLGSILVYVAKFDTRKLTTWMLGCAFIVLALALCQGWLGCNNVVHQLQENSMKDNSNHPYWPVCGGCICDTVEFYPICANDSRRTAYYSPCHAGCTNFTYKIVNVGVKFQFDYCACAETPRTLISRDFCQDDCTGIMAIFFLMFDLMTMASGVLVVPSILIALRSVDHKNRSLALGMLALFVYIFGVLPSGLLYRFVTDSSCFLWKSACDGGRGQCEVYETQTLRERFNGFAALVHLLAYLFYSLVWFHAKNLKLIKDNDQQSIIPTEQSEMQETGMSDEKKEPEKNGETVQNGGANGENCTFIGKL